MYPFIVVSDTNYGIAFDIVMADTEDEAKKIATRDGIAWKESWVIDISKIDCQHTVAYTEKPTGG
jgi:hypothetical protein